MSAELASELWGEIKRYVNEIDRNEAAEVYVSTLVDNDIHINEIKTAFRGDSDIKRALLPYLEEEEPEEEYDDPEDEEEY
jgi:hypothetical protein